MLHAYTMPLMHSTSGEEWDKLRRWWQGLQIFEQVPEKMVVGGEVNRASVLLWDQAGLLSIIVILTAASIIMALLVSITEFMGLVPVPASAL